MCRCVTIILILLLLVFTSNAQKSYSEQHLKRLSNDELFRYQHKSMELKKKGEVLTITGTGVALLGLILGSAVTDSNSSDGGSNALTITAFTMLAGGSVAVAIGLPMYLIGISRVHGRNQIKYTEFLKMELAPCSFYCRYTEKYPIGVSLKLRF